MSKTQDVGMIEMSVTGLITWAGPNLQAVVIEDNEVYGIKKITGGYRAYRLGGDHKYRPRLLELKETLTRSTGMKRMVMVKKGMQARSALKAVDTYIEEHRK